MSLFRKYAFIYLIFSLFIIAVQSCDIVIDNDDEEEYYDDWDIDDDDFNLFEWLFGYEDEDDDDWDYGDDDECYSDQILYGKIGMKVTINAENPTVKIVLYRGTIENHSIYKTIYAENEITILNVESGLYAAIAYYKKGKKTIRAIDGDKVSESNPGHCDNEVDDIELDLTL